MRISTLSIGDEVLFGEIVDTNAAHIATRMYDEGFMVQRHLCVGDNEFDIVDAIETLAGSNDFVIATGGLGPTVDDITAKAAAKAAGRRLVLNDEALDHLRRFYERAGREMVPSAEKQCLLPAKAPLVPNPVGTACGFMLPYKGTYFFFVPGVPVEMKRMLEETVIPAVRSRKKDERQLRTRMFRVFGLSETQIEGLLKDVAQPADGLSVAYCVNFPEVFVKLRIEGDDEARLSAVLDEGCAKTREKLGDFLFAEGEDTIDAVVARLFREKGVTTIVTPCPHCFSTLRNDYRQYGLELKVLHHSELIAHLLAGGRLRLNRRVQGLGKMVMHDSCYLGRHNEVYGPPRAVIAAATGSAPAELGRSGADSFCCGAGGGRMWLEEHEGSRINHNRVSEALHAQPDTICVSCPYCMTMFEDGLKDLQGGATRVMDLAEVVAEGLRP